MAIVDCDLRAARDLIDRLLSLDRDRKIHKVILFGSRAQGTAQADSDYDVLVVEKDPVAKRDEMHRLRREMCALPYGLDLCVIGEQEFEETKDIIGGLAYPANKYGQVLYEIS